MGGGRNVIVSVFSTVALLLIAAAVTIDLVADRAMKTAIEQAATQRLGVEVQIERLDLAMTRGKLVVRNLVVRNPAGYGDPVLLQLPRAKIYFEPGSLLGDVVQIRRIKLEGPQLLIEQKGPTNNLRQIVGAVTEDMRQGQAGKRLCVERLEIYDTVVQVRASAEPGEVDTVSLRLTPIQLTNLGGEWELDTAVLTGRVMLAIARSLAQEGAGELPEQVVTSLSGVSGSAVESNDAVLNAGR